MFPRIEEQFHASLDESLDPRGPDVLFDLMAGLGLPPGAAVLDVGCGEGGHAIELAARFGFAVTGIDLRPGGRVLVCQMFGTDLLEPREAAWLWNVMGVVPSSADPANTEKAMAAAGLPIDDCFNLSTEWGEWAQEHQGKPGRRLLHAARLIRSRDAGAGTGA